MLEKIPHALCLASIFISSQTLRADEKLDQILDEVQALREQITTLETRVKTLETENAAAVAALEPNTDIKPRQRKNLFDSMRIELQKAEVRASGPWVSPDTWTSIETGLKVDEIISVLGEPTVRKFSVRRDTDEILIYRGDLEGTGEPIVGEIRIYKGKVRRFTLPDFPESN